MLAERPDGVEFRIRAGKLCGRVIKFNRDHWLKAPAIDPEPPGYKPVAFYMDFG
jgi:hypothetical protein